MIVSARKIFYAEIQVKNALGWQRFSVKLVNIDKYEKLTIIISIKYLLCEKAQKEVRIMKKVVKIAMVAFLMYSCQVFSMGSTKPMFFVAPPLALDGSEVVMTKKIESLSEKTLEHMSDKEVMNLPHDTLDVLMKNSVAQKRIQGLFNKFLEDVDVPSAYLFVGPKINPLLVKALRYSNASFKNLSPTGGHCSGVWAKIYDQYPTKGLDNKKIRECLLKALHRQEIETEKGRYAYFHAQKFTLYLPQRIFVCLLERYFGKKIDKETFWALCFSKPGTNLSFAQALKIVQDGPKTNDRGDTIRNKHFMNCSLFANTTWDMGSDTLGFFLRNFNVMVKSFDCSHEALFEIFGWEKYYIKYAKEFGAVQDEMNLKRGLCGTLLVHSFDEDTLKKFVYVAKSLGLKKHDLKIQGRNTDDVKKIYKAMQSDPKQFDSVEQLDHHEYVLVRADDHPTDKSQLGSLNPYNEGIRTYHFTTQSMRDIEQMVEDVFVKIDNDIEQEKQEVLIQSKL